MSISLLLSDDLIFTSRIAGTAKALGLRVAAFRSQQALEEVAANQAPRCVILDLNHPGLNVGELVARLKALEAPPYVVGYGSHVHTAALKAARDAGCDVVLPRSKFVEELPAALQQWFAGEAQAGA
jgi:CheY-like chemotaxis protein